MPHGLQHRTTGRWLTDGAGESPNPAHALTFSSEQAAEDTRTQSLLDFADAWVVRQIPSPSSN